MKHLGDIAVALLADCLAEINLQLAAGSLAALLEYLDALIEANQNINLTRITDPAAAIRLHLVDSLIATPEVAGAPAGSLLDIGTGGGIPGVPLAVATGRRAVLLDSVGKKAQAVQGLLRATGLDGHISTVGGRVEDPRVLEQGAFAVVTARAVSELPALVELAAPLLIKGGRLVALKGSPDPIELERGSAVARICGLKQLSVRQTVVPGGDEQRTIVTYEKVAKPSIKLPRRVGLAQNSPLA